MKNIRSILVIVFLLIVSSYCEYDHYSPYPHLIRKVKEKEFILRNQERALWIDERTNEVTAALEWILNNAPSYSTIELIDGVYEISRTIKAISFKGKIIGTREGISDIRAVGIKNDKEQLIFPALSQEDRTFYFPPEVPPMLLFAQNLQGAWDKEGTELTIINVHFSSAAVRGELDFIYNNVKSNVALYSYILVIGKYSQFSYDNATQIDLVSGNITIEECVFSASNDPIFYYGSNIASFVLIVSGEVWFPNPGFANGWGELSHLPGDWRVRLHDNSANNALQQAFAVEFPYSKPKYRALSNNSSYSENMPDSSVSIKNNYFNNCGRGTGDPYLPTFAFFILAPSGLITTIEDNVISNSGNYGFAIIAGKSQNLAQPYFEQDPSLIIVKNNHISMINTRWNTCNSAIEIADLYAINDETELVSYIEGNKFEGSTNYTCSFINILSGKNNNIFRNRFYGYAQYAINIGSPYVFPVRATQNTFFSNGFSRFESRSSDLYLGPNSDNNYIFEKNLKSYTDFGKNNIFIN